MLIGGGLLLVCLYVDDILVAHNDQEQVLRLMTGLPMKYQVKDRGSPLQSLGMKINRHGLGEIWVSQAAYIDELLYRFAMDPVRPTHTPMVPSTRLDLLTDEPDQDEINYIADKPYRQVVGSLL